MVEEKVIQSESVTPAEQPVAETPVPQAPNLDSVKSEYEQQISSLKAQIAEGNEKFQGIKSKLDDVYKKADAERKKKLEDQGQWKDLWEEANKTAQEKEQQILTLNQELENLKVSNETAATKNAALAAISDLGAINAEQTLSLLQDKLKKNNEGSVVVLNGGVEQDLSTYLSNLKNPGSGWEHHFKASSAAGMGAKPTPNSNVSPGMNNPWKEGSINITRQMALESTEPELAAVLKREAQTS
jgi:DNA repair exonuclease SbcCD ATPase subunit